MQGLNAQNIMENCILEQLSSEGYKGKLLRDLSILIKNKIDYLCFENFILLNFDRIRMKSHYVYAFRLQVIRTSPLIEEFDFIQEYTYGTQEEKRGLVQDLAKEYVSVNELKEIECHLQNNVTTLRKLYSEIVEKRTEYNIRTVINLLSA